MTIGVNNLCRCSVALRIDGGETVTLQPFEAKRIKRDDAENIKVSVRRNCDSIKEKYVYSLVVETEYIFSDVADGAEFTVTREKIQFSPNLRMTGCFFVRQRHITFPKQIKSLTKKK